jgi:hypothetical protein
MAYDLEVARTRNIKAPFFGLNPLVQLRHKFE